MLTDQNPIGWLKATGSRFDIGFQLGRQGYEAVHTHLVDSDIWAQITASENIDLVARLTASTQAHYPGIWDEICGLAKGLDLPVQDVMAWNCRGDLLASVPDGCTTVQQPGSTSLGETIKLSHNEDGLPFFRGACFIVDATPDDGIGFRSFCYPGSIPGHSFGWNNAGIVQTVNNLRLCGVVPTVSRMVLGRAVIESETLDQAIETLSTNPACGGFHMSLAQCGDKRLLSVEYGGGSSSVRNISKPSVHANHALHLEVGRQIVTASSNDRQLHGGTMVRRFDVNPLDVLRDDSGPGLPIRRDDPADPDCENTLATCIFHISKHSIGWKIYAQKQGKAIYQSESKPS